MYLSRLSLNKTRKSVLWSSSSYRVHQRLLMAFENDGRILFRVENDGNSTQILVQSQTKPDWRKALDEFDVLSHQPECKLVDPFFQPEGMYHFRLFANPAVVKTTEADGEKKKPRLGLMKEADQQAWIERKMRDAGAELLECVISQRGFQHNRKTGPEKEQTQTHLAVLFEGVIRAKDPAALKTAVESGIGPAKGYGFGLLSLARIV